MGGSLYARQGGLYFMHVIKRIYWSCHKWNYIGIVGIELMSQLSKWNITKSPLDLLKQMHPLGRQWIKQMTLSAVLFPLLVCGTAFMINFIAIYYHASRAIPFATMVSWKTLTFILLYNVDNKSQEYMYIATVVIVSSTTFNPWLNAVMDICTGKKSEMYI